MLILDEELLAGNYCNLLRAELPATIIWLTLLQRNRLHLASSFVLAQELPDGAFWTMNLGRNLAN